MRQIETRASNCQSRPSEPPCAGTINLGIATPAGAMDNVGPPGWGAATDPRGTGGPPGLAGRRSSGGRRRGDDAAPISPAPWDALRGRQTTDDRGQRTEDGRQTTDAGRDRDGGRRTTDHGPGPNRRRRREGPENGPSPVAGARHERGSIARSGTDDWRFAIPATRNPCLHASPRVAGSLAAWPRFLFHWPMHPSHPRQRRLSNAPHPLGSGGQSKKGISARDPTRFEPSPGPGVIIAGARRWRTIRRIRDVHAVRLQRRGLEFRRISRRYEIRSSAATVSRPGAQTGAL
jgi:hypothetical protein